MPPVSTQKQTATVLVVDDDNNARERLCAIFEKAGFRALVAQDVVGNSSDYSKRESCDLIVLISIIHELTGLPYAGDPRPTFYHRLPVIAVSSSQTTH